MPMPAGMPGMTVSLRSRAPLIIVVLRISWPLRLCLMVILKSPLMGLSVSRVRCASEMAVKDVRVSKTNMNKGILSFIN